MEVKSRNINKLSQFQGSEIIKMYEGKTVFVTGATGFVGKQILEKLLRTCPSIKKIYILVRTKKGKDNSNRFDEIFSEPIWEPLEKQNPSYKDNVGLICGDLLLPNLGMSDESIKILEEEVNIIFHCAATVRFDEHIRSATYINVRAVRDLTEIAKKIKKLEVFLHVSTAYSQIPADVTDEKFYEPPLTCNNLLSLVEILSEEKLTEITPKLIGVWPNTYTFTKAIAESVIEQEKKNLPLVMCRPSIILSSVEEPLPGWVDNFYGPSGVFLGTGLGVIRCLRGDINNIGDLVPADYVVNHIIVVAGEKCKKKDGPDNEVRAVYNYCSSPQAPITWGQYADYTEIEGKKIPSTHCMWVGCNPIRKNAIAHYASVFFLHTVPAYLIDFFLILKGDKPKAVKVYAKVNTAIEVLSYFLMRNWNFRTDHTQQLWNRLNETDRKIFPFSMENFDWQKYISVYVKGIRVYLLKDPLDTIPEGEKKYRKLYIAHYSLLFILFVIGCFLLRFIINLFI